MVKEELIKRSPLRVLEKTTHGGLQRGGIGVFAGYKGVGKTACLVHVATDQLLQEKHVIHISFCEATDHIISWYEEIFGELASRYELDGAMGVHDAIIRNRIIMNFRQDGIHWSQIQERVTTLINSSHFAADTVVVDGYDVSCATAEEFGAIRAFASTHSLRVWLTTSLAEKPSPGDATTMPPELSPFCDNLDIIIKLINMGTYVHLQLIKDHTNETTADLHLRLDPRVLLIATED